MFGREPVDKRNRGLQVRDQDDRAVIAPARAGDLLARKLGELSHDFLADVARERDVVGDQDRLRGFVVFGLRKQVGGDIARVRAGIGEHDDLGWPRDHVDADDAEHPPLGGGDIGVARADDLRDRPDRRGAIGERGDRLSAADAVDFVDPRDARGGEHERIDPSVRRRHDHRDARAACDLGGRGVHQYRGGIARGAAGDIEPDRLDRAPAPALFDAERVGEGDILRRLPAVIGEHAFVGEFQRGDRPGIAGFHRLVDSLAEIVRPGRARSTRSNRWE